MNEENTHPDLTGILWKAQKKTPDSPDCRGTLTIAGIRLTISAWRHQINGKSGLTLRLSYHPAETCELVSSALLPNAPATVRPDTPSTLHSPPSTNPSPKPCCATCTHQEPSGHTTRCLKNITSRYHFQLGKTQCRHYKPRASK